MQSVLCMPAVTLSCWLWHISGESHLLCISLGGTGRKRWCSGEPQRAPHWKTGYFWHYNPLSTEKRGRPKRLREMLKPREESSSRAWSIIQILGTNHQDQDPCLKTVPASGPRPVLQHTSTHPPVHQYCCEPYQHEMQQSKKVVRSALFAYPDLS